MADDDKSDKAGSKGSAGSTLTVAKVRGQVGRVVWLICLVLALVLAAAAFGIALDANADNPLVELILDTADKFDLGFFDLTKPLINYSGDNVATKVALTNYGVGAVVYLVVGRLLERLIRP